MPEDRDRLADVRIRFPRIKFRVIERLAPLLERQIDSRQVWACRKCGQLFAVVRLPLKDLEEIVVRPGSQDSSGWDWEEIAAVAAGVRWRGSSNEARFIV